MICEDIHSEIMGAFRDSFIDFCEYFKTKSKIWDDFYHLDFATFHYKIEKDLLKFFKPKNFIKQQITAIIVARDEGKSKIVSVLYSIWNIFIKNRDHIVLDSAAKGAKSIDNLTDIIRLIEDKAFKEIFPWTQGKWTPSQGIIEILHDGRRILIRAIGIEGALLGATHGAARIELWIGDDLEDPEIASSTDRVDKQQHVINSVILPGMSARYVKPCNYKSKEPGRCPKCGDILEQYGSIYKCPEKGEKWPGQMIFIGTFHGLDCLLARINSHLWESTTKVIKFPALVPIGNTKLAKRLNVKEDCSIWEEHKSTEWLHKQRANYMVRGEEAVWEMQYMCRLVAGKKKSFRPEFWKTVTLKEAHDELKDARIIITFDMAYTKGKASDAVGCCIAAHLPHSCMIILRGTAKKMDQKEFYDLCLELNKEWGTKAEMYAETKVLGWIMGYIYERNVKSGENIEINPLRIDDNKYRAAENMINALIAYYNTDMIRFVEGNATKDLKGQMFVYEGIKTKGDAKWDALEAFGCQILFLIESQFEEDMEKRKWKTMENITVGEIADIYFKDKEGEKRLPHGLPKDWFWND